MNCFYARLKCCSITNIKRSAHSSTASTWNQFMQWTAIKDTRYEFKEKKKNFVSLVLRTKFGTVRPVRLYFVKNNLEFRFFFQINHLLEPIRIRVHQNHSYRVKYAGIRHQAIIMVCMNQGQIDSIIWMVITFLFLPHSYKYRCGLDNH